MRFHSAALLTLLAAGAHARPEDFTSDFRRDPARDGYVVQGADDGRFAWIRGRDLAVELDSTQPGARLAAPLGLRLDGSTSFRVEADFTLVDVEASPDDFFEIGFGLYSSTTSGLNRTGTSLPVPPFFVDDSDVHDAVELDYYPNVTGFGGPFLQPTVFGAGTGSAFSNFAANFGSSSDLGDNAPGQITELPQGAPLRVVMSYDACAESLVTTLFDLSGSQPSELATGLAPLDLHALNATDTFHVDSFGISAYQDLADFDPSTRSLHANVRFRAVAVDELESPSAQVLPRALNAQASAPARVVVRDAPADATVTLIESGGAPTSVALETQPTGAGLVALVPRALAVAPMSLQVGECVVPVEGPVAVPR